MRRVLDRFARDESGATALEYGLIIALIFLATFGALTAFGASGSGMFHAAMGAVSAALS